MRQLLLIDPLIRLNLKKDTSLMLALTLQKRGIETYILFEKDLGVHNIGKQEIGVYSFKGDFRSDGIYIENFELSNQTKIILHQEDIIHMRLDPPFDSHYLRVLWMLDFLSQSGVRVMNNPRGIMNFNEKLYAYGTRHALSSYIGESIEACESFLNKLEQKPEDIILKPLDLFSGIGVEKVKLEGWKDHFVKKIKEFKGPIVVQPFLSSIYDGELRSIYYKKNELGTILKKPLKGEYLSNIAQGALFSKAELKSSVKNECDQICEELSQHGVDWVAFDILGESIQEINITCPGLLVEVSYAYGENLCHKLIDLNSP